MRQFFLNILLVFVLCFGLKAQSQNVRLVSFNDFLESLSDVEKNEFDNLYLNSDLQLNLTDLNNINNDVKTISISDISELEVISKLEIKKQIEMIIICPLNEEQSSVDLSYFTNLKYVFLCLEREFIKNEIVNSFKSDFECEIKIIYNEVLLPN